MMNSDKYKPGIEFLYNFSQLLLKNNIKHWLCCGTLLHAYRDKAINRDDIIAKGQNPADNKLNETDYDISFCQKDYNRVEEVLTSNNINYHIPFTKARSQPRGYLLRLDQTCIPNPDYKVKFARKKTGIEKYKDIMWTDLYFWTEHKRYFEHHYFRLPIMKYFIEELDVLQLYEWKFPIPRYTEKYLQNIYGHTWPIPMTARYHYKTNAHIVNKSLVKERKTTVYVDGVWDLFHVGHVELLKRAYNVYDRVIVGVCSDEDVEKHKRRPIIPCKDRAEMIRSCKYVYSVYENAPWNPSLDFLEKNKFNYILHAVEDSVNWKSEMENAYSEEILNSGKFHYLSYTNYHTTDIINNFLKQSTHLVNE